MKSSITAAIAISLLIAVAHTARSDAQPGFEFAENLDKTQRRHRLVPDDDIWWTLPGEQMAWMHRNAHQLFPTVNVYRHGPVRELRYDINPAIGQYEVDTPDGKICFEEFLTSDHSTALGVVILHKGKIVFERYPRMKEYEKPVYWSTSKIFPATIIRIFEERGLIDVDRPARFYLPELAASSFADITVRNILDMASGIDCGDEYDDRQVVSDEHIEFLQTAGNPALRWRDGGVSIYQWGAYPNGNLSKGGWGGQGIIINPQRDLVAVFASYFKDDYSEVSLDSVVSELLEKLYGETR